MPHWSDTADADPLPAFPPFVPQNLKPIIVNTAALLYAHVNRLPIPKELEAGECPALVHLSLVHLSRLGVDD